MIDPAGRREMTPRAMVFSRTFALEVDGKPTLVFGARTVRQAQELCKESWLHDDLVSLKSGGAPLCGARSKMSVRPATAAEAAVFKGASDAVKPSDELVLAYLVELDGG
jgi:hypothetical protein